MASAGVGWNGSWGGGEKCPCIVGHEVSIMAMDAIFKGDLLCPCKEKCMRVHGVIKSVQPGCGSFFPFQTLILVMVSVSIMFLRVLL